MKVSEAKERLRMVAREKMPWVSLLESTTREYKKTSLLTALSTGLVLGSSAKAREGVRSLLVLALKNFCLPPEQDDEDSEID